MTSLARHAQQVIDLDAVELLPAPGARRPAPLAPRRPTRAARAGRGAAVERELVLRRGRRRTSASARTCASACTRTSGVAWYTAFVCGPGRPTVAVVDFEAPLPGGRAPAHREPTRSRPRIAARRPLERYRVRARRDRRGARRPGGAPSRRARRAGPGRARPRLGDRRRARTPTDRDALRDPLPGRPARCASATSSSQLRGAAASATTRGARATGGRWTGCGAPAISTTARVSTRSSSGCPTRRGSASATCSARASGSASSTRRAPARRSARRPRRPRRTRRARRGLALDVEPLAFGAAAPRVARRPRRRSSRARCAGSPRRRPHRRRLARANPERAQLEDLDLHPVAGGHVSALDVQIRERVDTEHRRQYVGSLGFGRPRTRQPSDRGSDRKRTTWARPGAWCSPRRHRRRAPPTGAEASAPRSQAARTDRTSPSRTPDFLAARTPASRLRHAQPRTRSAFRAAARRPRTPPPHQAPTTPASRDREDRPTRRRRPPATSASSAPRSALDRGVEVVGSEARLQGVATRPARLRGQGERVRVAHRRRGAAACRARSSSSPVDTNGTDGRRRG